MSAQSEWSDCVCLSICVSIFATMFLLFPPICIPIHAGFLILWRVLFSVSVAQPLPSFVFASFWFSAHKICSSLPSSLPPSSLSPPSYSLVSVHTHLDPEGIRLDLLRSSQHRVQSSCLSHLQVPCSDNIQRAFVCLGFTAILVALNATWYCCRLWAVFNWLLGDKRSFIVVWLLSGLSVNLLIWQESLFYNFQFEPGQLTLSLLVTKNNVLITWIHMTSPKSKSVAKCLLFLI